MPELINNANITINIPKDLSVYKNTGENCPRKNGVKSHGQLKFVLLQSREQFFWSADSCTNLIFKVLAPKYYNIFKILNFTKKIFHNSKTEKKILSHSKKKDVNI